MENQPVFLPQLPPIQTIFPPILNPTFQQSNLPFQPYPRVQNIQPQDFIPDENLSPLQPPQNSNNSGIIPPKPTRRPCGRPKKLPATVLQPIQSQAPTLTDVIVTSALQFRNNLSNQPTIIENANMFSR
ncbi:hypothetical protein HK096_000767, partial [Nowakowskiella sp. JEL0078]